MSKIKSFLKSSSMFRICYIIDLFLCNIAYVQIVAYPVLVILFIWGVVLCGINQKKNNTFRKMRFGLWIGAFLLCNLITMLINFSVMIVYSFIMLLHLCICFFLFYGMHTEDNVNIKKEFYTICRIIVYLTTILGILGIVFLLCGVSYNSKEFSWIKFIIYENRFTGVYINPNNLGFISIVSLVCCHMLTKKNFLEEAGVKRISGIWIVTCVGIDLFSLLLCDSNAALVLAICYVIFYVLYKLFSAEMGLSKRQIFVKFIALCGVGVFVVCSAFMFRIICQKGFAAVINTTTSVTKTEDEKIAQSGQQAVTFSHINQNLDSGRFKLAKESVNLFRISPFIGISNGNIVLYSEQYTDGVLSFSYHYSDLHNGYLTLLVSTGILGFGIFVTFGFRFAKHIIQHLFRERKPLGNDIFPCLFSFLCGYLVYALFEKALLYDVSFMVLSFWLFMGVISTYLKKYEPSYDSEYIIYKKRLRRNIF